jgi:glutathionyl-hydroquinone reductase
MGLLVNVQWRDQWYDTSSSGGRFLRKDSAYRNWVTRDGAPGPTGHREGTEIPLFPLAFELGQLGSKVDLGSRNDRE